MANSFLWTKHQARLCLKQQTSGKYHWLFLPGGPGFGSESLHDLTQSLSLPGCMWHVDLPADGSNLVPGASMENFAQALYEVTLTLPHVILVAHSAGGMFALATKELQKTLNGLILLSTAPDQEWQSNFERYVLQHPLTDAIKLQKDFENQPSDHTLKEFSAACAPYFFRPANLTRGIELIRSLPINYKAYAWAQQFFHPSYRAQWIPSQIPVMILAGDRDRITPLEFFRTNRQFQLKNIQLETVEDAAHFPWIDNPNRVHQLFKYFCSRLD